MTYQATLRGMISATALTLLIAPFSAHAAEGPGWGPGHGMMWGGPTRNWFGWGASEHFCGDEGKKNVDRFMALIDRYIAPTEAQKPSEDALKAAFGSAQEQLASLCEKPHTGRWSPIERLMVAEAHLNAMLNATHAIKGPLEAFYNGLTDDQKAKMDSLKPDWRMSLPWSK